MRSLYYQLPESFRLAVLVRVRAAPHWKRAGVIFVHIPKAAGTSISHALYGRSIAHPRALDIERWATPELRSLPSFAVSRNPWDRLVSAYRFAKRGRGIGGARQSWVWRPEQYQVPEFDTFERFVKEWLAPRDVPTLDGVFQPQSAFVCDADGRLLVDHIGKLEDLGTTFAFLREKLGYVPAIEEANRSGERVDYRTFYTAELMETVGQIYQHDVRTFGYDF